MAEYIKREAAIKAVEEADVMCDIDADAYRVLLRYIEKIPAADVVPVRHGKWIDKCVRDWRCSECGWEIDKVRHVDGYCYDNLPRYCPDCGARMDGDGE